MGKTWCHRIKTEGVFLEVRQMLPESPYLFLEKLKNGKKINTFAIKRRIPPMPPSRPFLLYFFFKNWILYIWNEMEWNGGHRFKTKS